MSTRATLRSELALRLGDSANQVWTVAELNGYLDYSIKGLYPAFFIRRVATSVAENGPLQEKPDGARNLYFVGLKRSTSTRVRPMRGWAEGDTDAYVPKTGITGEELVWAWTEGWDAPANDSEELTFPREGEDVVLTRCHIRALEKLLTDRVSKEKYFNLNVREGVTEVEISDTIDGLRAHLNDLLGQTLPLPEMRA